MGIESVLSYSTSTSTSVIPELFYNPDSGAAGVQLSAQRSTRTRQCPRGDHELTGTIQIDVKHRRISGKARALKQFYMRDADDTSAPFLQAVADYNSSTSEPLTATLEARQLHELSSGAIVDLAAGARVDVMGAKVSIAFLQPRLHRLLRESRHGQPDHTPICEAQSTQRCKRHSWWCPGCGFQDAALRFAP
jgi:hypothetical protein